MAIQFDSRGEKTVAWLNILFYFSLVLIIVAAASYFLMKNSNKKADMALQELESQLVQSKTAQEYTLENYQNKINDYKYLLENYIFSSQFFGFLEKNTHPKVQFLKVQMVADSGKVQLSGLTDSFQSLGQQLIIFKKEGQIKEINLSDISFGDENEVRFSFSLVLDPKVLKHE